MHRPAPSESTVPLPRIASATGWLSERLLLRAVGPQLGRVGWPLINAPDGGGGFASSGTGRVSPADSASGQPGRSPPALSSSQETGLTTRMTMPAASLDLSIRMPVIPVATARPFAASLRRRGAKRPRRPWLHCYRRKAAAAARRRLALRLQRPSRSWGEGAFAPWRPGWRLAARLRRACISCIIRPSISNTGCCHFVCSCSAAAAFELDPLLDL